ncbi:DUF1090 family protein [Paraburkholderia sp. DHOC27]|nr:DUF1090 family protein [Paraburkholderia sp. DHOC27]
MPIIVFKAATYATDAAGPLRSAMRDIAKAQTRLAEREHDLQVARSEGNGATKLAQRQRKVDDAHAELDRLLTERVN